jgi:hypothetical protein
MSTGKSRLLASEHTIKMQLLHQAVLIQSLTAAALQLMPTVSNGDPERITS